MTTGIKPYLQLIRLPNVFTAAADSLAGWLLVHGSLQEPRRWLPLVLASMAIYAAGIALNDWFDYAIDLEERPGRPLPSGQVSRRFAAGLGGTLLLLGPENSEPKNAAMAIGTTKLTITERLSLKNSCRSLRTIARSGMTAISRASSFRSA